MCLGLPIPQSAHTGQHPNTQPWSSLWRPPMDKLMSPTVCIFNCKWNFKKTLKYYFPRNWFQDVQAKTLPFMFPPSIKMKEASLKFSFPCSRSQTLSFTTTGLKVAMVSQHDALAAPRQIPYGSCSGQLTGYALWMPGLTSHLHKIWTMLLFIQAIILQSCFVLLRPKIILLWK